MKTAIFFIGMLVGSIVSFVFLCCVKVGSDSDKHIND